MASRTIATQVLVVGGGPVGLTLAMDLAWRGIEVVVAELRHRGEPPASSATMSRRARWRSSAASAWRKACATPACRPTTRTTSPTAPPPPAPELARIPIPAAATATPPPAAPTPGGPRPSRRTASTRSTWSRCCSRTPRRCRGVTHPQPHAVEGFRAGRARVSARGARPRQRRDRSTIRRATSSAATAAASAVRKAIGATLEGTPVVQRVQSTYIRAPRLLAC